MKLLIGLLLVGLAIEGRAQLTCFDCQNCGDPFDRTGHIAQACPQTLPPIVPTPPNEGTTVAPPTPPIGEGPILTPPPVPGTTVAPGPGPDTTLAPGPPTDGPIITPPPIGRRKRQADNTLSHRCYVMTHNGNTRRGCTTHGNDFAATCRTLNQGQDPHECRLCDWAECNSASGITVSIAALLAAVLIALRLF